MELRYILEMKLEACGSEFDVGGEGKRSVRMIPQLLTSWTDDGHCL